MRFEIAPSPRARRLLARPGVGALAVGAALADRLGAGAHEDVIAEVSIGRLNVSAPSLRRRRFGRRYRRNKRLFESAFARVSTVIGFSRLMASGSPGVATDQPAHRQHGQLSVLIMPPGRMSLMALRLVLAYLVLAVLGLIAASLD